MHSSVALQRQQRQPPLNDIHRLLEKVIVKVRTQFYSILFSNEEVEAAKSNIDFATLTPGPVARRNSYVPPLRITAE